MIKIINNIKTSSLILRLLCMLCIATVAGPLKAKTTPKFSDYPIKAIYRGPSKLPDFKNDEYTEFKVKSEIEKMKKGPDFAGHYTIMRGGCGSDCIFTIAVDNITGKIFNLEIDNYHSDIKYKIDSKMLLVSTTEPFGSNDRDRCILEFYVWEVKSLKKLLKKDLGPTTDKNGRELINCSIGDQ